jgi:ligand-binding sensor domain-containing protein
MLRFLIVISFVSPLVGLSQQHEIKHIIKYNQLSGLSSYNVRKVIQDNYGFIWVATQDGLSKFDGNSFFNYSKNAEQKHQLCGVDIRELIEDSTRKTIWVLPGEYGINTISTVTGTVTSTIPIPHSSPEDWNISMSKYNDELWIGTSTGVKVFDIKKRRFESLNLPHHPLNPTEFEVRSFAQDNYGNVWVCYSGYGIVIYDALTKQCLKKLPLRLFNDHLGNKEIKFFGYAKFSSNRLVFATSQGLRQVQYDKLYNVGINNSPCTSLEALNFQSIQHISPFKNSFLIASSNALYRFDSSFSKYSYIEEPARLSETDWLNAVQCITLDSEQNLWLGCQEGLAFIPSKVSAFTTYNYDKRTNTKLDHVRSIFPLDNGDILAGLRTGIVYIDHLEKQYRILDSTNSYHHIFQDPAGLIHVSRTDGMFIFYKKKLTPIQTFYPEFSKVSSYPVNSHVFLNDSIIILGTENAEGVLIWNRKNKSVENIQHHSANSVLGSNIVNSVFKDSRRNLWVLSDNLISVLSPQLKAFKILTLREKASKKPFGLYFDMCEAKNSYWIASYGVGIIQLDSSYSIKTIYANKNGLSNDGVYQVYNVGDSTLLITTDNGLSLFSLNNNRFKSYFAQDGLHSNGFEEVCGLRKNDLIYAGGVKGFSIIDTKLLASNLFPPKVFVSNVRFRTDSDLCDTTNLFLTTLNVPNNTLQTTISFSGLNYSNPTRTTYSYKINELQPNWINLNTQNFVNLIGLSPGTYHLLVKAANEDGVWSKPIELELIFLPKWYQTWWFKALIILAVIAIAYALYRMRIAQLKKEQVIRTKLASDLHDDLGSTLNSVKVYANLALMDKQQDKYLYKIKESIQEAISGTRDIIWVLDDKKDVIEHLVGRLEQFALPLCEANNVKYLKQLTEEAKQYKLSQEEKRNLYMILKEAVNNSIKYAQADKLELLIELNRNKPVITIRDNGRGFNLTESNEGNGLKNMKRRSTEINYKLEIDSAEDRGTMIRLWKN